MNQKSRENCAISEKKNCYDLHQHRSVFVTCMWTFFVVVFFVFHEFDEMTWRRSELIYPSKKHCNPVIHQSFRESKIQVVMLPLKGHMAIQTKCFQGVMQEYARKWQVPGTHGHGSRYSILPII